MSSDDDFHRRWTEEPQDGAGEDGEPAAPAARSNSEPFKDDDSVGPTLGEPRPLVEPDGGTVVISIPGIATPAANTDGVGRPPARHSLHSELTDRGHGQQGSQGPPPRRSWPDAAHEGAGNGPSRRAEGGGPGLSVGSMRATIREADLTRPHKPVPKSGWRSRVWRTTRINLGLSPGEREWNDLQRRFKVNLRGTYLIAVMQTKGGAGKTTTALGIGAALAQLRDEHVVAIDANPANGNLARRIDEPSTGTWRGLIADPKLYAYSDFRSYLGKDSSSGLEVLASDPGDQVLTGRALHHAWSQLKGAYPIGIVDCGTQLRDDVTRAVLDMADAVVVPSTTRLDGAAGAADTLNWLLSHGYPHLVHSAVVVISNIYRIKTPSEAVRGLHEDFERVVRAVHSIPFDAHLNDAGAIDSERMNAATKRAYIEAAASVVDGFGSAGDREAHLPSRDQR
jgi:MinD-like ATPase involved in chromosome partitioning or flagellar assembly